MLRGTTIDSTNAAMNIGYPTPGNHYSPSYRNRPIEWSQLVTFHWTHLLPHLSLDRNQRLIRRSKQLRELTFLNSCRDNKINPIAIRLKYDDASSFAQYVPKNSSEALLKNCTHHVIWNLDITNSLYRYHEKLWEADHINTQKSENLKTKLFSILKPTTSLTNTYLLSTCS